MKKNKSIILLSGGLDSVVSLALLLKTHNIELAVTFNYGQKASEKEIIAAKLITQHYHIKHKVIELNWLKEITHTSLVSDEISLPNLEIDNLDNQEMAKKTAKSVWVPNRNGLFVNIAACFADSYNYSHIIIGANKEEAATFIDNGPEFINKINISLEHSTNNAPKVIAPLIDKTKMTLLKLL
jgi:7-cyano-7-deazaguanine synthase